MITVLAGGVGAARFLQGLMAVQAPSDITIVSDVGDDAQFFGLHVSPDIDIALYHLARHACVSNRPTNFVDPIGQSLFTSAEG